MIHEESDGFVDGEGDVAAGVVEADDDAMPTEQARVPVQLSNGQLHGRSDTVIGEQVAVVERQKHGDVDVNPLCAGSQCQETQGQGQKRSH